jgi:hypothetical protein
MFMKLSARDLSNSLHNGEYESYARSIC